MKIMSNYYYTLKQLKNRLMQTNGNETVIHALTNILDENKTESDLKRALESLEHFVNTTDINDKNTLDAIWILSIFEKDLEKSIGLCRKAADHGYAPAQNSLALCYKNGTGVVKDMKRAVELYRQSADQGYAAAQCNLGLCYANGIGVVKDIERAIELYRKSADQGNAPAQSNLAFCYENGIGVEKDMKRAVELYRQSADQGFAGGQNGLAICYEQGKGVEKDIKRAVELYRQSADQGNAFAQYNLALCYQNGKGVEKEMKKAFELYRQAADQMFENAQSALKELDFKIKQDKEFEFSKMFEVCGTHTKSVILSMGRIGPKIIKELFEALKNSRSITSLTLSLNQISLEGAQVLAQSLKENTTLMELLMLENSIDREGMLAVIDAIKDNRTITNIRFLQTVDPADQQRLQNAIETNTSLLYFNSEGSRRLDYFSPEIEKNIDRFLKRNNALTKLRNLAGLFSPQEVMDVVQNPLDTLEAGPGDIKEFKESKEAKERKEAKETKERKEDKEHKKNYSELCELILLVRGNTAHITKDMILEKIRKQDIMKDIMDELYRMKMDEYKGNWEKVVVEIYLDLMMENCNVLWDIHCFSEEVRSLIEQVLENWLGWEESTFVDDNDPEKTFDTEKQTTLLNDLIVKNGFFPDPLNTKKEKECLPYIKLQVLSQLTGLYERVGKEYLAKQQAYERSGKAALALEQKEKAKKYFRLAVCSGLATIGLQDTKTDDIENENVKQITLVSLLTLLMIEDKKLEIFTKEGYKNIFLVLQEVRNMEVQGLDIDESITTSHSEHNALQAVYKERCAVWKVDSRSLEISQPLCFSLGPKLEKKEIVEVKQFSELTKQLKEVDENGREERAKAIEIILNKMEEFLRKYSKSNWDKLLKTIHSDSYQALLIARLKQRFDASHVNFGV